MKSILKLALIIALVGTTAMAGEMGNGGGCTENCTPPPPPPAAQQSSDDTTASSDMTGTTTDAVIDFVENYLELMF